MSMEAEPARSDTGTGLPATATASADQSAGASMPAAATGPAALRTMDLTLSFGTRAVLSDISTEVQRGGITALIGPTGSGKSTLLRTFNRMNDKVTGYRHAGDVLLDGRSIWHPGVDLMSLRQRVGMLFQRPNPFPMSILDNVVAGARAHKMASRHGLKEIAEQRLREVGLWDAVSGRLKDSPFRLSGGQQQLLCLARALAIDPEVLLLDEPTSSLDPIATESIEALIKTLAPKLTVVIVTHNLAQARRVSDSTIFLYQGHMVEHSPTDQIFNHPAREETARYVGGHFG
jgi:phosphate transport system ATP-binding protein